MPNPLNHIKVLGKLTMRLTGFVCSDSVMYYIVLNVIPGLLVENHLILLNDFLCPACNVTCSLGVPALQGFRAFIDVETCLVVQKNFDFHH